MGLDDPCESAPQSGYVVGVDALDDRRVECRHRITVYSLVRIAGESVGGPHQHLVELLPAAQAGVLDGDVDTRIEFGHQVASQVHDPHRSPHLQHLAGAPDSGGLDEIRWLEESGECDVAFFTNHSDFDISSVRRVTSPIMVVSLDDGAVILDDTLSMNAAVSLAWDLRGTPADSIRRLVLPVESTVSVDGRFALRATKSLLEVLAES